jgi:hypothetical protein
VPEFRETEPSSTQQCEQAFPRKRIFTTILKIRCKLLIYNEKWDGCHRIPSLRACLCRENTFFHTTRTQKRPCAQVDFLRTFADAHSYPRATDDPRELV